MAKTASLWDTVILWPMAIIIIIIIMLFIICSVSLTTSVRMKSRVNNFQVYSAKLLSGNTKVKHENTVSNSWERKKQSCKIRITDMPL